MEELTREDIDDWLLAHGMHEVGSMRTHSHAKAARIVWLCHADGRANWVRAGFISRVANSDAGIWPIEEFQ